MKLGDLCEVVTKGTTPTSVGHHFVAKSEIKFIKVESLNKNGSIIENKVAYITEECHKALFRSQLKEKDILFSIAGALGRVGIVNQDILPANTNQALAIIRLKDKNETSIRFLQYYFQSQSVDDQINGFRGGVAQQNLSLTQIKDFNIPQVTQEKQQQIVEKLDTAFELIDRAKANIEKNIQNAKELFQSKLNQVFSEKGEGENFELKKLSELGSITSSKRIYKSEYVSEGVPFYRTKELKELAHGKEISLELYITKERYVEIKNRFGVPLVGDILLSAVGTIGEILVIENENEFYFKDGNIVWFKDFRMVNPYYLRYLLITFVENIKNMAQGAAYSALTIEKINEYKVYFPKDLKIQQNIVEQLDILSAQTKHLQQKYQQKLVNLEELKISILENAFKGELV